MLRVAVLAYTLALASGFAVAPLRTYRAPISIVMDVEAAVADCIEDGCSVDMVSNLVDELKAESAELTKRNAQVSIAHAQACPHSVCI